MSESNPTSLRRLTQFSVRSLLILMMLVAAYATGWMSHRAWNQRNVDEAISRAIEEAEIPVKLEFIDGTDIVSSRGRKEDVDKAMPIIEKVQEAARQ